MKGRLSFNKKNGAVSVLAEIRRMLAYDWHYELTFKPFHAPRQVFLLTFGTNPLTVTPYIAQETATEIEVKIAPKSVFEQQDIKIKSRLL